MVFPSLIFYLPLSVTAYPDSERAFVFLSRYLFYWFVYNPFGLDAQLSNTSEFFYKYL
jgi:hypothetical protein